MKVSANNDDILDKLLRDLTHQYRGRRKIDDIFQREKLETLVFMQLNFEPPINEIDRRGIIDKSISIANEENDFSINNFKKIINTHFKEHMNLPLNKYRIVSNISINKKSINLHSRRINECHIYFYKKLPTKYSRPNKEDLLPDYKNAMRLNDYLWIIISVNARSEHEAFEKSERALRILKGLWNFTINRSFPIEIRSGIHRKAFNKITTGPFYTFHDKYGKEIDSNFLYYEDSYRDMHVPYKKQIDKVITFEKNARKILANHPYRVHIESLISDYCEAFDHYNLNTIFMELWILLEKLTNKNIQDNLVATIKRAAFLHMDDSLVKAELDALREYRNKAVHHGENAKYTLTIVYILKNYVEKLFLYHINNPYRFQTFNNSVELLDYPKNETTINSKMKMYRYAKKYHNYK